MTGPRHRSVRALLTHTAPASSQTLSRWLGRRSDTPRSGTNANQPASRSRIKSGRVCPMLCVMVTHPRFRLPLCQGPSLHKLRRVPPTPFRPGFPLCSLASSLLWPCPTSRLRWRPGFVFFPGPGQCSDLSLTTDGISRVPHKRHPCMHQVSDSGAPDVRSRLRFRPCGLPLHPTRSARSTMISELNTEPASSPVNA